MGQINVRAADSLGLASTTVEEALPTLLSNKSAAHATQPELEKEGPMEEKEAEKEDMPREQKAEVAAGGGSESAAAGSGPSSVLGPYGRHGERERRHLKALGFDLKDADEREGDQQTKPEQSTAEDEARQERIGRRSTRKAEKKAQRDAERMEQQARVRDFLDKHGFPTVKASRRWMFRTQFPLHVAIREKDAEMTSLLVKAGANPMRTDSSGRTALELAHKLNSRAGSHSEVIKVLNQASVSNARKNTIWSITRAVSHSSTMGSTTGSAPSTAAQSSTA